MLGEGIGTEGQRCGSDCSLDLVASQGMAVICQQPCLRGERLDVALEAEFEDLGELGALPRRSPPVELKPPRRPSVTLLQT